MKLLQKSEINALKARDTNREISEGLKLSRRVDSLRELQQKEEVNLEKYRTETLKAIKEQIKPLEAKKEALEGEIKAMQGKLDAMLPSIGTKREELRALSAELTKWQKELEKKAEEVLIQELDVAEAFRKAEKSLIKQVKAEEKASLSLEKTINNELESNDTLQTARKIKERTEKDRKEIEYALQLRENALALKERAVREVEKDNTKNAEANAIEKLQLADQRATMQRQLERMKNLRT
jgi:hypothetical protein